MPKATAADIYTTIRREIITGGIPPSALLQEQAVAQRFEVNRLTAREALQKLCVGHYLENYPRKGYLVVDITREQLGKIQQVRFRLESLSVKLVIQTCTDQQILELKQILKEGNPTPWNPDASVTTRFHMHMAKLSGNEYIGDILYGLLGSTTRYAMTAIHSNRFPGYVSYHEQIVDAMLQRDEAAAIEWLRKDLLENMEKL